MRAFTDNKPNGATVRGPKALVDLWVRWYEAHYAALLGRQVMFPYTRSGGADAATAADWRRVSSVHLRRFMGRWKLGDAQVQDYLCWLWVVRVPDLDDHVTGLHALPAFLPEYRRWLREHADEVAQSGMYDACVRDRGRAAPCGDQLGALLRALGAPA